MRTSALVSAALAGSALASPLVKREPVLEIDTVYDVVYTTAYVTETAGATTAPATTSTIPSSTSSAAVESTSAPVENSFFKAHKEWFSFGWTTSIVASVEIATSSASEAAYTVVSTTAAPSTTAVAASTSVYVEPSSSSITSEYAASITSSAAETTTSSAATSKATTYQQKVLLHHNVHRANHSASDLTWSADLASTAQTIAESCVYAHDVTTNGGGYGQNIAAGVTPDNIAAVITDLFYNGEVNYFTNLYGQTNPTTNFESWGHFSQVVWKATTQVGCATVDCSSSGLSNVGSNVSPYFTVCNYKSPGNYANEYATNVGASLGRASVGSTYGL